MKSRAPNYINDADLQLSYAFPEAALENPWTNLFIEAFFDPEGQPKQDMLARLREDIAALLYPTRRRALDLAKAYRTIVADQDYVHGRDATLEPAGNVHRAVEQDEATGIAEAVTD